jgi:hypothetical protein
VKSSLLESNNDIPLQTVTVDKWITNPDGDLTFGRQFQFVRYQPPSHFNLTLHISSICDLPPGVHLGHPSRIDEISARRKSVDQIPRHDRRHPARSAYYPEDHSSAARVTDTASARIAFIGFGARAPHPKARLGKLNGIHTLLTRGNSLHTESPTPPTRKRSGSIDRLLTMTTMSGAANPSRGRLELTSFLLFAYRCTTTPPSWILARRKA